MLTFDTQSQYHLATLFIRKMLDVAQLHLRFCSIRTSQANIELGVKRQHYFV